MELERTHYMNTLYDLYGRLLTAKQQHYMEQYFCEDWSLGEIAEADGVTRQAVYDNICRSETILKKYEAHLGLANKQDVLQRLKRYVSQQYAEDTYLQLQLDALD